MLPWDGWACRYLHPRIGNYLLCIISLRFYNQFKLPKALVVPPTQLKYVACLATLCLPLDAFVNLFINGSSVIPPSSFPLPFTCSLTYFVLIYCFSIWHFFSPAPVVCILPPPLLRLPYPPPPLFPSRFINWICTCSIPPPLPTLSFLIHPPLSLPHSSLPPFALVDFLL